MNDLQIQKHCACAAFLVQISCSYDTNTFSFTNTDVSVLIFAAHTKRKQQHIFCKFNQLLGESVSQSVTASLSQS